MIYRNRASPARGRILALIPSIGKGNGCGCARSSILGLAAGLPRSRHAFSNLPSAAVEPAIARHRQHSLHYSTREVRYVQTQNGCLQIRTGRPCSQPLSFSVPQAEAEGLPAYKI